MDLLARTVSQRLPKLRQGETILCVGDSLTNGIGVRAAGAEEGLATYPAQLQHLLR